MSGNMLAVGSAVNSVERLGRGTDDRLTLRVPLTS